VDIDECYRGLNAAKFLSVLALSKNRLCLAVVQAFRRYASDKTSNLNNRCIMRVPCFTAFRGWRVHPCTSRLVIIHGSVGSCAQHGHSENDELSVIQSLALAVVKLLISFG